MKRSLAQERARPRTPLWAWCALAVVLILAAVGRARLLEVPLQRDEGEYAYIGQLLLQGVPPYTLAQNMKLPGIYGAYAAVIGVLGPTLGAIHLGLLLVNAVTTVLVFRLARCWLEAPGAVAAAAGFALLSIGQPVQGMSANAEHFVLPFALAGLIVAQRPAAGAARLLSAGALLGTAVLMKQHGAAFAACGLTYALAGGPGSERRSVRLSRAGWMAAGIALPWAITGLALAAAGAFGSFWFWTVQYAIAYTQQVPLDGAWEQFLYSALPIARASPLLWLLVAAGPVALWLDPDVRPGAWRVLVFAGFSLLAICPGFFFRPHYFVLTLPAAGVLLGATLQAVCGQVARRRSLAVGAFVAFGLVAAGMGDALTRQREFLFTMSPHEVARSTYGANPFPESLEIARYIREHSAPDDTIAILGSEPQILFYANRRSATPYVYTYALVESHEYASRMQQEMIADIETARPRFLVFVGIPASWRKQAGAPSELFEWFEPFHQEHYDLVGVAEIFRGQTRYRWGGDVRWPPRARNWVALMQRKPGLN